MIRYVRVFTSIWDDDDFRALTERAQRAYMMLISQRDISHAGVLPLAERRWGRLAADTNATSIRQAIDELVNARFVVIDESTDELLVRSFVKYDQLYTSPNGLKAVRHAAGQVISKGLRDAIADAIKGATEGAHRGATEAPTEGAGPGVCPPQAANEPKKPMNQSSRGSTDGSKTARRNGTAAAAENPKIKNALDLAVLVRYAKSNVNDFDAWEPATRAGINHDHGARMAELADAGRTDDEIVMDITRCTRTDLARARRKAPR